MSGQRYRLKPQSPSEVIAVQWDDNWPEVSLWAYGEIVETTEEDYDSDRYWLLPADDRGVQLSALIDGNEVYVDRDEWLVMADGKPSIWSDEMFTATYEAAS